MPVQEDFKVSLGNGEVIKSTEKSLLVKLEDYEEPVLIPHSVIHVDSEVYGTKSGMEKGDVVVMTWWAEERGFA